MIKREHKLWCLALEYELNKKELAWCPSTKTRWCPCDMVPWLSDLQSTFYALYF